MATHYDGDPNKVCLLLSLSMSLLGLTASLMRPAVDIFLPVSLFLLENFARFFAVMMGMGGGVSAVALPIVVLAAK